MFYNNVAVLPAFIAYLMLKLPCMLVNRSCTMHDVCIIRNCGRHLSIWTAFDCALTLERSFSDEYSMENCPVHKMLYYALTQYCSISYF